MPPRSFFVKAFVKEGCNEQTSVDQHSRFCPSAHAIRVAVGAARLRVVLVVVCPAVVAELVNVREVRQAIRVHHGEAVLGETGGGVAHRKAS